MDGIGRSSSTAFLSPVVNRGMRKPFGELTNTPPGNNNKRLSSERTTPLKTCASELAGPSPTETFGTPMANLKLLMRVASEVSSSQESSQESISSRRELFKDDNDENVTLNTTRDTDATSNTTLDHDYSFERRNSVSSVLMTPGSLCLSSAPTSASSTTSNNKVSRKDKSLGLLCDKFISRFPRSVPPTERCEIPLDDLAKQMSTERRRIYDIVNVLEAVQMMTKIGKNLYQWHGTAHQTVTLAWLRQLAAKLDMLKRYSEVKRLEAEEPSFMSSLQQLSTPSSDLKRSPLSALSPAGSCSSPFSPCGVSPSPVERKTSLGVACQKFLMLFLIAPESNAKINLDFAAKVIHGVGLPEAIMKTRIRRLYDIANILQSLKLIQKVQITEMNGGKKPAFQYIGPNVETIEVTKDVLQTLPSTRQRHSLLTFGKSLMNIPDEPMSGSQCFIQSPLANQKRPSDLFAPASTNEDEALNLSKKPREEPEFAEPENLSLRRSNSLLDLSQACEQERMRLNTQAAQHVTARGRGGISLLKRALTSPGSAAGGNLHIVSPMPVVGRSVMSEISIERASTYSANNVNQQQMPQAAHQSSYVGFMFGNNRMNYK